MSHWTPDRYQAAVLERFRTEEGHLAMDAPPGTGKTRTLGACLEQIDLDQTRVLVASYSRALRDAWARRLPDHENLTVSTLHGLGLAAIRRAVGRIQLQPDKYRTLVAQAVAGQGRDEAHGAAAYRDRLEALVAHALVTLTPARDRDALWAMALRGGLDVCDWEHTWPLVGPVIDEGLHQMHLHPHVVAFEDLVAFPHREQMPIDNFDVVIADEIQDISPGQAQILQRSLGSRGRALLALDGRQAILGFAGSDPQAMADVLRITGAQVLPLRICYRCPRSHIALANALYDVLEPRPGAPDGTVQGLDLADAISHMRPGDLVLCRTTGPLLALAFRLLSQGQRVRVLGQDIAGSLHSTVTQAQRYLEGDEDTFGIALGQYSARAQDTLERAGEEALMASTMLWDRVHAVRVIWEHTAPGTVAGLRQRIEEICLAEGDQAITLATVHRGKGLEAERVFILRPDLLPHPRAKTAHQRTQEKNLAFVSLTRSTRDLVIITPPDDERTRTLANLAGIAGRAGEEDTADV